MAINPDGTIGQFLHKRTLTRWLDAASNASDAELATLRAQRQQARQLRSPLQELTRIADIRLALPRIGSNTFARPAGTDWAWRPQQWRGALSERGIAPVRNKDRLGHDLTVFHDCPVGEIAISQIRNTRDDDLAAYGISLEVFSFTGNFVSLVLDVPKGVCEGLRKQHLIQLAVTLDRESPVKAFARLNVKHGPNTETVLETLPDDQTETVVEFDLGHSQLNEKRVGQMWIDLMFENPYMNRITLRDLNICRFPRAEL